jgi:hypothetical protein
MHRHGFIKDFKYEMEMANGRFSPPFLFFCLSVSDNLFAYVSGNGRSSGSSY